MKYYQEITLIPDSEISLSFIWSKTFQQIHIALAENKIGKNKSNIAVGFPQYDESKYLLGNKLRLFAGNQEQLEQIDIKKWLYRLSDYLHIKAIKQVPNNINGHVCFIRKNIKSPTKVEQNIPIKANLLAKKSGRPFDECLAEVKKNKPSLSKLPFIFLGSQETKKNNPGVNNRYPIFIKKINFDRKTTGIFDCYGFSAKANGINSFATLPDF